MPRILLIVDEFQEFFVEDDKLAQEAALLLDRLVRQGRAFGIHVLLGSQTLGGAYSLARSTHRPDGGPHRAAVQRGRRAPDPQRGQHRRPAALAGPARRSTTTRTAWSRATTRSRSSGSPTRSASSCSASCTSGPASSYPPPLVFEGNTPPTWRTTARWRSCSRDADAGRRRRPRGSATRSRSRTRPPPCSGRRAARTCSSSARTRRRPAACSPPSAASSLAGRSVPAPATAHDRSPSSTARRTTPRTPTTCRSSPRSCRARPRPAAVGTAGGARGTRRRGRPPAEGRSGRPLAAVPVRLRPPPLPRPAQGRGRLRLRPPRRGARAVARPSSSRRSSATARRWAFTSSSGATR